MFGRLFNKSQFIFKERIVIESTLDNMVQKISSSNGTYLKNELRTFTQLVEEDKIRLESPEAKEEFLAYADKLLNS